MSTLDPNLITRLRQMLREELKLPPQGPAPVLPEKFSAGEDDEPLDLAWLEQALKLLPLLLPGPWRRYAWLLELAVPYAVKKGPALARKAKDKLPALDRDALRIALLKTIVQLRAQIAQNKKKP